MKQILKLILIGCILLLSIGSGVISVDAGVQEPTQTEKIGKNSIDTPISGELTDNINTIGISLLRTIKVIFGGLLVIYMVYIGVQMIISMGSDDEELSKAKRQVRYSLVALLFINMPETIYYAFKKDPGEVGNIDGRIGNSTFTNDNTDANIFFDIFSLGVTLDDNIIGFLKILIFGIAVFMIILAGLDIMTARGREEKVSEAKSKIIYSVLGLIFIGVIEVWKRVAFSGDVGAGFDLFGQLARLALFLAGPIAIFFLTLAGYYFITSNGEEERVKKAKSIVINTVLATLILLAAYTFLLDLSTL